MPNEYLFFLPLFSSLSIIAKDDKSKLPTGAQKALSKFKKDVDNAESKYFLAVKKAKENAIKKLQLEEKNIVRAGNLDGAILIRKEIKRIEQIPIRDVVGKPINRLIIEPGDYRVTGAAKGIATLKSSHSVVMGKSKGKWSIDRTKNALIINWIGGNVYTVDLATGAGSRKHGGTVHFEPIKK